MGPNSRREEDSFHQATVNKQSQETLKIRFVICGRGSLYVRAVLVICGLKLPLLATVNRGPDARQNVAFFHVAGKLVLVDSVWSLSTEMGPSLTCPRRAYHIALLLGEKTEEVGLSFSQVELPEGPFFITPSSHHSSLLGHRKKIFQKF